MLTAAAVVLHNVSIDIREDPPVLPEGLMELDFRNRMARGHVEQLPPGRPDVNKFEMRNLVIRNFFQ